MKKTSTLIIILAGVLTSVACQKILPVAPEDHDLLDGSVQGLNYEQAARFGRGDLTFNDKIFTTETGLGPIFVSTSCGSCHPGDGKGHPFTSLIRFGQTDDTGNKFHTQGGPQLQNRALPGYQPEALPSAATFSTFTPPMITGLGFLDLVSDADILAMTKENETNIDGIRGQPNWITLPSYIKPKEDAIARYDGKYISRFGLKASIYNLLHQTVEALNQDIGITSIYNPIDQWSGSPIEPEILASEVHDLVFYLQTLKAPIQRNPENNTIKEGKSLFKKTGCDGCHRETLKTGTSPITALNKVEFHPYTDLLVHNMGSELDDKYTEGTAKTFEWRTAPLWGLGLAKNSQGGRYFLMHDGRARSIEEAILLHGGEAKVSRDRYLELQNEDKKQLIAFLESL